MAVGSVVILVYLAKRVMAFLPHRTDHNVEVMHRLGMILAEMQTQTALMKQPAPPESVPEVALKFMSDWAKAQEEQQAALDELNRRTGKQGQFIQMFCRTITGNDPGSYEEVDDETAEIREEALKLQRRYPNLTLKECVDRAKKRRVYEPNDKNGFGADV